MGFVKDALRRVTNRLRHTDSNQKVLLGEQDKHDAKVRAVALHRAGKRMW